MSTKIYDAYTIPVKSVEETASWVNHIRDDYKAYVQETVIVPSLADIIYDLLQGTIYRIAAGRKTQAKKYILSQYNRLNSRKGPKRISDIDSIASGRFGMYVLSQVISGYWELYRRPQYESTRMMENLPTNAKMILYPDGKNLRLLAFGWPFSSFLSERYMQYGLSDFHHQDQTDRPEEVTKQEWSARNAAWDRLIGPDYIPGNHGMAVEILAYDKIRCLDCLEAKQDLIAEVYEHLCKKAPSLFDEACYDNAFDEIFRERFTKEYLDKHPECKESTVPAYQFEREFEKDAKDPESEAYKRIQVWKRKLRPYMLDFAGNPMHDFLLGTETKEFTIGTLLSTPPRLLRSQMPGLFC